jgi:hypothetical protein
MKNRAHPSYARGFLSVKRERERKGGRGRKRSKKRKESHTCVLCAVEKNSLKQ